MIIIKYIFLFFVFSGAWLTGNLISKKYKIRVKELKDFKEFFNILESKMKFTYEPLGEIFEDSSDLIKSNNIAKILKQTCQNLKKYDFKLSWEKSIDSIRTSLCLSGEDINIIKGLGNLLRKN